MKRLISSRFSIENSKTLVSSICQSQTPSLSEVKFRLEDGRYNLKQYSCPCGSSKEDIIISEIDRYGLPLDSVLCMKCGTVRIDPYLDTVSLDDFYSNFYQKMYGRVLDLENYFERQKSYGEKIFSTIQKSLKPEGWVCEIGCGAGGGLKVFQDQKFKVAGCDYSHELIESGRKKGVTHLFYGGIDEIKTALNDVQFDLIYLHHVFEHLSDPLAFLKDCRKILAGNGKIIIVIPDIASFDSSKFPAGDLLQYLHIAHKYNFSLECLRILSEYAGYSICRLNPDSRLKTPCSDSSELWIEMVIKSDACFSDIHKSNSSSSFEAGEKMLKYLRRTEKSYSLGLCKGQVFNKIESFNSRFSLRRILGKIKNSILVRI